MRWQDDVIDVANFPAPGVIFKDITPLLAHTQAFHQAIDAMADICRKENLRPDFIACPEARGFIFASALAYVLPAGLIPIRKPGKLPRPTRSISYALEYGESNLSVHVEDVRSGARFLLIDDVLATGGTMLACTELLKELGADVRGCLTLLEFTQMGARQHFQKKYPDVGVYSLITVNE